jgi:arylsulfatase A-like enzyme
MKTVFVLFDSLNRHLLGCYGGTRFPTPGFDRLTARSLVFDKHYVGSLPCMPARRDMLTGRLTFLHRSWGPLEPFDNAFPELLKENGTHAHLITDHYHYWEDGGATYHNRYSTFEFVRGQEFDPWKAMVQPPWERLREKYHHRQASERFNPHIINREFIREEADFPSVKCFAHGREFLDTNRDADNWLGSSRSRPSTRTSRFSHRRGSRSPSTPAGTARSATGHAMARSTNCRPKPTNCAPITTPRCRCAIS